MSHKILRIDFQLQTWLECNHGWAHFCWRPFTSSTKVLHFFFSNEYNKLARVRSGQTYPIHPHWRHVVRKIGLGKLSLESKIFCTPFVADSCPGGPKFLLFSSNQRAKLADWWMWRRGCLASMRRSVDAGSFIMLSHESACGQHPWSSMQVGNCKTQVEAETAQPAHSKHSKYF